MDLIFQALNAASATGPGTPLMFDSPRKFYHPSIQISYTGAPSSFVFTIEATLDGVIWCAINESNANPPGPFNIIEIGLIPPVMGLRGNLQSIAGGTSPTVTVLLGLISDGIAV